MASVVVAVVLDSPPPQAVNPIKHMSIKPSLSTLLFIMPHNPLIILNYISSTYKPKVY